MAYLTTVDSPEIFLAEASKLIQRARSNNSDFLHFTGADKAKLIIETKSIWLTDSRSMSDTNEIQHGLEALRKSLFGPIGSSLLATFEEEGYDLGLDAATIFHCVSTALQGKTYISSMAMRTSAHPHGRLSMWREYAREDGVALVVSGKHFLRREDRLHVYSGPVSYGGSQLLKNKLVALRDRARGSAKTLDPSVDRIRKSLLWTLAINVCFLKHRCFSEEKEWRIVAIPEFFEPSHHVIPVRRPGPCEYPDALAIPLTEHVGLRVRDVIKGVIIGPSHQGDTSRKDRILSALTSSGELSPDFRVEMSNIPYRPPNLARL